MQMCCVGVGRSKGVRECACEREQDRECETER